MEQSRVRELLELYFEAQTTIEQERELSQYFASAGDIPADLLPYKAIFAAFDHSKQVKSSQLLKSPKPRLRVLFGGLSAVAVAAALLLGLFIWVEPTKAEPSLICYIDGVQVEDREVAMAEAEQIFSAMAQDIDLAMATIEKIQVFYIK
ncbi:MAG: hypothetical protein IJZ67_08410 [Alistipes sp.]|nr:hypothetical protein [Alistipes sp.]